MKVRPISSADLPAACGRYQCLPHMVAASERHRVDMRMAAYNLGVGRVAEAKRLRGLYA